jgi:hypothetical protein
MQRTEYISSVEASSSVTVAVHVKPPGAKRVEVVFDEKKVADSQDLIAGELLNHKFHLSTPPAFDKFVYEVVHDGHSLFLSLITFLGILLFLSRR